MSSLRPLPRNEALTPAGNGNGKGAVSLSCRRISYIFSLPRCSKTANINSPPTIQTCNIYTSPSLSIRLPIIPTIILLLRLWLRPSSSPALPHPHCACANRAALLLLLLLPLRSVVCQSREVVPEAPPVFVHVRAWRGRLLPFVAFDETVEAVAYVLAGLLCLFGELGAS